MNKVITINLGGNAYQLEEVGYDALRAYLENAAARLQGNPDRDEIVSDIEQAIGEKFRGRLSAHKTVILAKEVDAVIAEMGPIEDDTSASSATAEAAGASSGGASTPPPAADAASGAAAKRLYRVHEGAMLAGVCNGLGAYFNIDPTLMRLAFVLLTLIWGTGILVYLIMAIVVPAADSPAEKAAAYGAPFTAQEFIRRARQGYYDAMKNFPDRKARREWKRRFKQEMRDWQASFHREMASGSRQWQDHWRASSGAGAHPGLGVALPMFSLMRAILVVLFVSAVISLLATGGVFGVMLPATVPVWIAVVVLLFVYGMLGWPLKMMRRACYYDLGGRRAVWPAIVLLDVIVWLAVAVVLLWLARHHLPQVRDAVHNVPALFHQAVNDVRDWWQQK